MSTDQIRSIFVPFLPLEAGLPASVKIAASLAARTRAHVTVRALGVRVVLPYSIAGEFASGFVETANKETLEKARADADAAKDLLEGVAGAIDARAAVAEHPSLMRFVAQQGRAHDLAVVDRIDETLATGRAIIEELLFSSGRPVLVAPPGATEFRARRIVIAWDGGAHAARAVADALPLLRAAEHAEIVCVTNEKDLQSLLPGAEIAPHLARHGVKAEVVDLTAPDRSAARAIREHATLVGADLIVMGAYAHSRLQQFFMGGVTDSMLHSAAIPVFMSY